MEEKKKAFENPWIISEIMEDLWFSSTVPHLLSHSEQRDKNPLGMSHHCCERIETAKESCEVSLLKAFNLLFLWFLLNGYTKNKQNKKLMVLLTVYMKF